MANKLQALSTMTTRQKAMIGVFALIIIIVIWQVMGLMGGESAPAPITPAPQGTAGTPPANFAQGPANRPSPQQMMPQPAPLQKATGMTQREMELMKLQQETQAKYLEALNELQMLRVSRELAETNQAIMTAKLATVTAQKGIMDLLAPPAAPPPVAPQAYARGLVSPTATGPGLPPLGPTAAPEVTYSAISVSQLQYKWSAVLGYQGNLYHVSVGDILPADGSKVISIDKSGVVLEKEGVKKKISLVAII